MKSRYLASRSHDYCDEKTGNLIFSISVQSHSSNTTSFFKRQNFDYIIAGAGCAGLSLLYRMMQHPFFQKKQILVIDQVEKKKNDRTWCFWEQEAGVFEPVVHHSWKQIDFYSDDFSSRFDIVPYEYKMIRSADFYQFVLEKARRQPNIFFYYGTIETILNDQDKAVATIDGQQFSAYYLFNSIIFEKDLATYSSTQNGYFLLQHFKGWFIETDKDIFNARVATFMDFRVGQQYGTSFMYMLPVAFNKALIEYTLFTPQVLQQYQYDEALQQYIHTHLQSTSYTIMESEFGVIPMTNHPFPRGKGRIVHIGTAGGQTKPSSGFTFRFIQKHSDAVIHALVDERNPHIDTPVRKKRFHLYDSVMLNVLYKKKLAGDEIFTRLFKKNSPQRILRFLDNETSLTEDLKILGSMPAEIFLPATIEELLK